MTSSSVVLTVSCVIAALAQAAQVGSNPDAVTLLQAQVQEVSAQQGEATEGELTSDYKLADTLKCASEAAPTAAGAAAERGPAAAAVGARQAAPLLASGVEPDPPGAGALRATLLLMIVVLIIDGMRRWRLQRLDAVTQKGCHGGATQTENEAAAEAAWVQLVRAATAGDPRGLDEALSRSPPLARTDTWGCTPLHFASASGSSSVVAEFLRRGAEVDARDASDETPLHFAARAGHVPACESLLGAKADVNALSAQDQTPLVVAGHAGHAAVCRFLADSGAGVAGLADEQLPLLVVNQLVQRVFAAAGQ